MLLKEWILIRCFNMHGAPVIDCLSVLEAFCVYSDL